MFLVSRWSALAIVVLAACGKGSEIDDVDLLPDPLPTTPPPLADASVPDSDPGFERRDSGLDANETPVLCAKVPPLIASTGIANQVRYGAGKANGALSFAMKWSKLLFADAAKNIPRLADLNGDKKLDIMVNPRKHETPVVIPGLGTGEFSTTFGKLLGAHAGGWGPDLGDLDGDGLLDVAMGDHTAGSRAWLNKSTATSWDFKLYDTGLTPGSFSGGALADLDGDGKLDLVVGGDQFATGYRVFRGAAAGAWIQTTVLGLPPYKEVGEADLTSPRNLGSFAFADYDGDGDLDMFSFGAPLGTGGVSCWVYRNDGGGGGDAGAPLSFTLVATLTGGSEKAVGSPHQGGIADIDEDGKVDVLVGGSVYLQSATGGTWTLGALVDPSDIARLADFNGDCHLDILTHSKTQGLRLYLGNGTGKQWTPKTVGLSTAAVEWPYGIDVGDLDGDGKLDVVRSYEQGNSTFVESWLSQ